MLRVIHLEPHHVQRAAAVLSDAFGGDATYSWGRALGRDPDAFRKYVSGAYVPGLPAAFPRSLVAVDAAAGAAAAAAAADAGGGNVLGVLALEDFFPVPDATPVAEVAHEMQCIRALVHAGDAMFLDALAAMGAPPTLRRGRFCYFAFLATDPSARRRGVARALVTQAITQSTADGFEWAFALCTSPQSAELFRASGFQCFGAVVYRNFVYRGATPFASIPDQMSVMALRLG